MATNAHLAQNGTALDPHLTREIVTALRGLRFGSIELIVHDGRIVQLERHEKVRFDHDHDRSTT
jgi:hypothetical protein